MNRIFSKTNSFALAAVVLVAFGGCSSVRVDSNPRVNFSKYKTYAWMEPDVKAGRNPAYYNELASQNVESTVDNVLGGKGLQRTESRPDLLIGYHFFVEQKTRTVTDPAPFYGPYYGWGRWGWQGWGPSWYGWGGGRRQEQYNAGTVVVDMVDARTRKLVWRGSVEDAVNSPARISTELARQVEKIVEKYPQG